MGETTKAAPVELDEAERDQGWIACAVCFKMTGKRVKAGFVVNNYSVCTKHFDLASRPGFSIFNIGARSKTTRQAV